jgi:hypothetical protein
MTTRTRTAFLIGAALVAGAVLVPAAQARLIDGDEGFYLFAARLLANGQRLYADFFFPQMPVAPQTYGGWFAIVGAGWRAGRLLTALLGVGTGVLLAAEAWRRTQRWGWGAAALGLYLSSGLVLGWFTVAKTYALAALLLVLGATLLQRPGRRATFFGALALGLAAGTRLYLLAALPCAAICLWRAHPGQRTRRLLLAGAGLLVAVLPLLPALLRDPHAFRFGTVTFHALRDPTAAQWSGQLAQKWRVLLAALSLRGGDGTGAVQLLVLLVVAAGAALSPATPKNTLSTPLWMALLLASLVPTPAHPQYFCLLVPFLILDAVALLATAPLARAAPLLLPAAVAYVAMGVFDGDRYLRTGTQVPGVETADRSARWTIPTLQRVAAEIDAQGAPAAVSWWPGYFVSTRTTLPPELANDFGLLIADQLPPDERRRVHLVTHDELAAWIEARRWPLVVTGNWTARPEASRLPLAGYRQVARVENVGIWLARTPP